MKRLFDVLGSLLLLTVTAPLLLATAILIRVDTRGAPIYASPRVGKGGRIFGMLRFRTVDLRYPQHLSMNQRLSRAGRLIRSISLDDLPNLINVLRGEMSLVGPRPTEPERVDSQRMEWQRILSVRPGMISYAILMLAREYNDTLLERKLALEMEYVVRQSLWFDIWILLEGFRSLIASRGNIKMHGTPRG